MATPVVTCFLRNRDDVLLMRRSDEVGSYRGQWGGVFGFVEPDSAGGGDRPPAAAARAEIAEEAGLLAACELVRAGEPFEVADENLGTTWLVHPFLFDCDSRAVEPNEETVETAWVPPTEILRREAVPDLWTSYDRVRPMVESVRTDESHGSAYVSIRALDVLRDRAGELAAGESGGWEELAGLARNLRDARPGMAALRTRIDRAMAGAAERTPAAVAESAQGVIEAALDADDRAAEQAADLLAGERVLTLSRSGTVLAALRAADPEEVVVAESRPAREGVGVAEALAAEGVDVTLLVDAAVAHHLAGGGVDAVLVGADSVLADGGIVNKVGTRAAALAAAREGVALYAVAARDKVVAGTELHQETGDEREVYDGEAAVTVAAPRFDVTPADLVAGVVTEDGLLDADDVTAVARDHQALASWREPPA